jgi:hypothetical protein
MTQEYLKIARNFRIKQQSQFEMPDVGIPICKDLIPNRPEPTSDTTYEIDEINEKSRKVITRDMPTRAANSMYKRGAGGLGQRSLHNSPSSSNETGGEGDEHRSSSIPVDMAQGSMDIDGGASANEASDSHDQDIEKEVAEWRTQVRPWLS